MTRKSTLLTVIVLLTIGMVLAPSTATARTRPPRETASPHNWTALHIAARDGDINQVKTLLKGGANIEAASGLGRTPLHLAVMWNRKDVVRLLIASGANVNAPDRWKITPLRRAMLVAHSHRINLDEVMNELRARGGRE